MLVVIVARFVDCCWLLWLPLPCQSGDGETRGAHDQLEESCALTLATWRESFRVTEAPYICRPNIAGGGCLSWHR